MGGVGRVMGDVGRREREGGVSGRGTKLFWQRRVESRLVD